jgi:hypothetical protein
LQHGRSASAAAVTKIAAVVWETAFDDHQVARSR